jgi:hypothetical protein
MVPSFLLAWPIVFLLPFFCFSFVTSSAIFYHYSRTGYEDKRAMRRLFFAYLQRSDPGLFWLDDGGYVLLDSLDNVSEVRLNGNF